ncbi:N-acetyltransferase [Alteromonadaceae bacterium M269]|nr:N-acetyltransferase [Alteromonadaceae bacterium M269]
MMTIRRAEPKDCDAIVHFNCSMALETEDKVLSDELIRPGVERLLNTPEYGFYLVAEGSGELCGGLMVTFEWSDWRNGLFWWVQSVYVLPQFRRQGIYKKLYEQVKTLATESQECCGYRLYVEKQNTVAQKVYENLGMHETHYLMYEESF